MKYRGGTYTGVGKVIWHNLILTWTILLRFKKNQRVLDSRILLASFGGGLKKIGKLSCMQWTNEKRGVFQSHAKPHNVIFNRF
jgi:hypothetical protein